MNLNELDYHLPEELIAQQPSPQRCDSRLFVLDRRCNQFEHRLFSELVDYLRPGDCLVLNNTKVIPARFFVRRAGGGQMEGLFLELKEKGAWEVLLKNASRLHQAEVIYLQPPSSNMQILKPLPITVVENQGHGLWRLRPQSSQSYLDILNQYGAVPLPPYIRRGKTVDKEQEQIDRRRYQTVYAEVAGAVAAPTAGLHFTAELLDSLRQTGVNIARVTLQVGLGTFQPVTAEKIEDHPMHAEWYQLDKENADLINRTLNNSARVIAVGTTTVRTLETRGRDKQVQPGTGWTRLLITPGYQFQVVSALITNFHLPRTTLLALVCAFAGTERVLAAYREAIRQKYRFYSYGDAMVVL